MSGAAPPTRLRQSLRAGGALVLTLTALSPAASVYVTGAAAFRLVGTGAVAAILVGGLVTMIATTLYAELGAAFPHAGGIYFGVGQVLGARWGLVVLALGVLTAPALLAFAALGLATYVGAIEPQLPRQAVAVGALAAATIVALLRLRTGLFVNALLLAVELTALGVLSAVGWARPARSVSAVLAHPVVLDQQGALRSPGALAFAIACLAGAYACSGASLALNFGEEVRRAPRVIGRVVLASGTLAVLLVALPIVALAVGTPDLVRALRDEAPIAAALAQMIGPAPAEAVTGAVALAILGHVAGALIAYSRLVFAAARTGHRHFPLLALLATTNERSGVPAVAAAALGGVAMLLTLASPKALLTLVTGELVTPALMIAAVFVGRRRHLVGQSTFRSPFYPALPCLAVVLVASFVTADLIDPTARISLCIVLAVATTVAIAGRNARQLV